MRVEAPTVTADEDRAYRCWIYAILAAAMVLRLFGVFTHPVDQDELYTIVESRDLYRTSLQPGIQGRPLYYLIQHGLFWVLPPVEPFTRFLPTIAGVAGVWVVGQIARRIGGVNAALATACIAAGSPWLIYASETARYYSVVFLLVAITAWFVLVARAEGSAASWRRVALSAFAGILVHPSYVVGAAGILGWSLMRGSIDSPRWRFPTREALTGFLPISAVAVCLLGASILLGGRKDGIGNGGARVFDASLRLLPTVVEWATPIVCATGVLGLGIWLARPRDHAGREAVATIAVGSATTVALLAIASQITATYADYAVGAMPALCVGTGLFVSWAARGSRLRTVAVTAMVLAGTTPSLVSHLIDGTRFDYRPAFDRIRSTDHTLVVLVWPDAIAAHYAADLKRESLSRAVVALDSTLKREGLVWAIVSEKRFGNAIIGDAQLPAWLQNHCRTVESFEKPRFDFRMYRTHLQQCSITRPVESPPTSPPDSDR